MESAAETTARDERAGAAGAQQMADALRLLAIAAFARGGCVLRDWRETGDVGRRVMLIDTGSEVTLALEAAQQLAREGIEARVVSMRSTSVFERAPRAWREAVLPGRVPRVAVEAGVSVGWRQYMGLDGGVVGIDRFGESAPAAELAAHLNLTAQAVADEARRVVPGAR